jgi:hypothetical protein
MDLILYWVLAGLALLGVQCGIVSRHHFSCCKPSVQELGQALVAVCICPGTDSLLVASPVDPLGGGVCPFVLCLHVFEDCLLSQHVACYVFLFASYDLVVDHQMTSGTINHWGFPVMLAVW